MDDRERVVSRETPWPAFGPATLAGGEGLPGLLGCPWRGSVASWWLRAPAMAGGSPIGTQRAACPIWDRVGRLGRRWLSWVCRTGRGCCFAAERPAARGRKSQRAPGLPQNRPCPTRGGAGPASSVALGRARSRRGRWEMTTRLCRPVLAEPTRSSDGAHVVARVRGCGEDDRRAVRGGGDDRRTLPNASGSNVIHRLWAGLLRSRVDRVSRETERPAEWLSTRVSTGRAGVLRRVSRETGRPVDNFCG